MPPSSSIHPPCSLPLRPVHSLLPLPLPQTDLAKSLMNNKGVVGSKVAPMFGNRMVFTHSSRVLAAGADWLELERPLHVDVQMGFKPLLYK